MTMTTTNPHGQQLAHLLGSFFAHDEVERLAETFETMRELASQKGLDAAAGECERVLDWLPVALPTFEG